MNHTDVLKWRDEMSLGEPRIDDDHKRMLVIVNAFELAAQADIDFDDLRIVLREFQIHVESHFEREESLMDAVCYPFADAHKAAHAEFANNLQRLGEWLAEHRDDDAGERPRIVAEFAIRLRTWLADDIFGEDLRLRTFLAGPADAGTDTVGREPPGGGV